MDETFGFNAFFKAPATIGEAYVAIDEAAAAAGLDVVSAKQGTWAERKYAGAGRLPLSVALEFGAQFSQLSLHGVHRSTFESYGAPMMELFLKGMCIRLDPRLGRSFRQGGLAVVHERELDGSLECLDWFQYLGASIVEKWTLEYLLAGPFHKVEPVTQGGCVLLMGRSPFEGLISISKAADYLGITLRPIYSKNSKGNRIELKWP